MSRARQLAVAAGWVGYLLVLWLLALVVMPTAAPVQFLDTSWYAMLAHDWREGLQYGSETVFTYGPLGWLLAPATGFDADLYGPRLAATLIAMLAVAAVLTALVRRLPGPIARGLGALLVLGMAPVILENVWTAGILAAVALLLHGEVSPFRALPVCALLAIAGLVKFTCVPPALAGVAGMVCLAWRQRSPGAAAVIAGGYLGATAIAWVLAGQQLGGIVLWLQRSLEITVGYQDAMGKPGPGPQAWLGAGCALLIAGLCAAAAMPRPRRLAPAVLSAFVMAVVLVTWKAGFVRHDQGHARLFFGVAILAPFTLLPLWSGASTHRRWYAAGTLAVVAMALGGIEAGRASADPGLLRTAESSWQRLLDNVAALAAPRQYAAGQDAAWRAFAARTPLEQTRLCVGNGGIDAFGHEQGILIANRLRIVHRPVFQSYSAYTQELQELNAACYESPGAPGHVLFKLQPIDDLFPTVADSQALLVLLSGYTPESVEHGFLLLKRDAEPRRRADIAMPAVFTGRVALGDWVGLADLPGTLHLLELDLGYSLPGRLQGLLLRPPPMQLEVRLSDGRQLGFRIAPAIARAPFLVDPFVQDTRSFFALHGGVALPRVAAFRVVGGRSWLTREVGVRVLAADGLRRAAGAWPPEQFERLDRGFYPMFHARPFAVTAAFAPEAVMVDGTEVLAVHAPSELCFRLEPGRHTVSGGYGIRDEAWREKDRTDGVAFRVLCRSGTQELEVLQRLLQPCEREGDRGTQRFRVEVDAPDGAVLVLGAGTGPRQDPVMDWSYWTDIRIEPQ